MPCGHRLHRKPTDNHYTDATQFSILVTIKATANRKNTWANLSQSVNPFFYSKSSPPKTTFWVLKLGVQFNCKWDLYAGVYGIGILSKLFQTFVVEITTDRIIPTIKTLASSSTLSSQA